MKQIVFMTIVAIMMFSCGDSSKKQETTVTKSADVTEVFYFHGKQRCVTCNAIERLTKEVIDSLASDKIVMKIIDISKKENESIADKYEVTWSSLIIDYNGKVENITNMGFRFAKNQPAVFKTKLAEVINNISK